MGFEFILTLRSYFWLLVRHIPFSGVKLAEHEMANAVSTLPFWLFLWQSSSILQQVFILL